MALTSLVLGPGNVNFSGQPTGDVYSSASGKIKQTVTYTSNGFSTDTSNTVFPLQYGVPQNTIYPFQIIPAESGLDLVASATNPGNWLTCVSAARSTPISQANTPFTLTLQTSNVVSTVSPTPSVSILSYAITYNNVFPTVAFDCERSLSISFLELTGTTWSYVASTNTVTVVAQCIDYRGIPFTATEVYEAGTGGSGALLFSNPAAAIQSITFSANPFSGGGDGAYYIAAGNGIYIGLPYKLVSATNIISSQMNAEQQAIADEAGFWRYTGYQEAYDWRSGITSTSTLATVLATLNSGVSARGIIEAAPQGTSSLTCDGSTSLTFVYYIPSACSEPQANFQNLNQSAVAFAGLELNTDGQYTWPYWVDQDIVGMQVNSLGALVGDNPVITSYIDALNSK